MLQLSNTHRTEFHARWLEEKRYRTLAMVEQRLFSKATTEDDDNQSYLSRSLIVGGSKNGLYERMFKQQPRMYMTRAQFLTCMRTVSRINVNQVKGTRIYRLNQVFGLKIAETDQTNDGEWIRAINLSVA